MRIPRESEDITLKKNSESDTINQIVMAVGRKWNQNVFFFFLLLCTDCAFHTLDRSSLDCTWSPLRPKKVKFWGFPPRGEISLQCFIFMESSWCLTDKSTKNIQKL